MLSTRDSSQLKNDALHPSRKLYRKIRLLKGGGENRAWLVQTGNSDLAVLKICTKLTFKEVALEASVITHLLRQGLSVPEVIEVTMVHEDKKMLPAMLYRYIPGQTLRSLRISSGKIRMVGTALARMDVGLASFPKSQDFRRTSDWDLTQFNGCKKYLRYLPASFAVDMQTFASIFDNYAKVWPVIRNFPAGLIHNDASETNIVFHRGKLAGVIDFSDMLVSPYICNVAVTAAHLCFETGGWRDNIHTLVSAYQSIHYIHVPLDILLVLIRARLTTLILSNYYGGKVKKEYHDVDWMIESAVRRLRHSLKAQYSL